MSNVENDKGRLEVCEYVSLFPSKAFPAGNVSSFPHRHPMKYQQSERQPEECIAEVIV